MKTRTILFIAILSFAFASSATVTDDLLSSPPAISQTNMLILHGVIHNNQKATILVFEYDEEANEWFKSQEMKDTKDYQVMLNPTTAYQIWYMSPEGGTKIMYIDKGDEGRWEATVNIDFSLRTRLFSHMYQFCNHEGSIYVSDFLPESQCSILPANNVGENLTSN